MKAGGVVVSVAVSRGAVGVHGLDVGRLDDRPVAALGRLDGRRRAAHHHARVLNLGKAETVGRGEVPLLAGGEAGHNLGYN